MFLQKRRELSPVYIGIREEAKTSVPAVGFREILPPGHALAGRSASPASPLENYLPMRFVLPSKQPILTTRTAGGASNLHGKEVSTLASFRPRRRAQVPSFRTRPRGTARDSRLATPHQNHNPFRDGPSSRAGVECMFAW